MMSTNPLPLADQRGAPKYPGPELAVVGCMKHLSVEGRRTLARFASDLEDAEARGLAVLRIQVVTATADNKASA